MNHGVGFQEAGDSDKKMTYEKDSDDQNLEFDSGSYHFVLHHNHAKNYLDASRVQVGTSFLSSHSSENGGKVVKYRVRFTNAFKQRPIVFVSTIPQGAAFVSTVG